MANSKSKTSVYFYIFIIIAGCVLACTNLIPNDYLKLIVVMVALFAGLYGIAKGLNSPKEGEGEEETNKYPNNNHK
jgi:predicted membrane channel-forming protein YqfA (hemolysin III family)